MSPIVQPVQQGSVSSILGAVSPTRLVEARDTLHHAAQLLALAAASYIEPRSDDSHTSMSWLQRQRALATQPFDGPTPFRFALGCAELTLLRIEAASGTELAAFPMDGRPRVDALTWLREQISLSGLDETRLRPALHFTIASHPTDDGASFQLPRDGSLEELTRWYAVASALLEERSAAMAGAGPVRCWPHHFDIAMLVRLTTPGALQTIGIGMSPGDDSFAEPYYYVGPHPAPNVPLLPLPVGSWHTEGWWGAALTATEIVAQSAGTEQPATIRRFIDAALAQLLAIHEQPA
jgi:hypothetical protein